MEQIRHDMATPRPPPGGPPIPGKYSTSILLLWHSGTADPANALVGIPVFHVSLRLKRIFSK